jgi:hypothetical protein
MSAGRSAKELWWTSQELSAVGIIIIITVALRAHISPGGWTIGLLVAADLRHRLTPSQSLSSVAHPRQHVVLKVLYVASNIRFSCAFNVQLRPSTGYISRESSCGGWWLRWGSGRKFSGGWTKGLLLVENSMTHQGVTLLHTDRKRLAVESSV